MKKNEILQAFPWQYYSKKLKERIKNPRHFGSFTEKETQERNLRLAKGISGSKEDGNYIELYWIVDKEDGTIVDAKYKLFGQSALIGAAEFAIELLVGKNYDQAQRISADLIEKQARDKPSDAAFPKVTYPHLNLIIDAIDSCVSRCQDLPLPTSYIAPPTPGNIGEVREGGYPGFDELDVRQQIALIEEVLNQDIRPYIALDAGGVEVINLIDSRQLIISYQGSCTSCYSSTGATLSYIQQVLRAKVHPLIEVTPSN